MIKCLFLVSSAVALLAAADATSFYGQATELSVGSSDIALTEQQLLDAVEWNVSGVEETIISNTYLGTSKLGTYYYTVEGSYEGVSKRVTNTIEVFDNTLPEVAAKAIRIGNNQTLTLNDLLAAVTATDNSTDILKYTIISNSYEKQTTPGVYGYTVEVEDGSGNKNQIQNLVYIYDAVAPTIVGNTNITSTFELSDDEIISLFQIKDDVSDDLKISIERGDKTILKAMDEEGNETQKEINLNLIQEDFKVIYLANKCLVSNAEKLTTDNLKCVASYLLDLDSKEITSISTDYLDSPEDVGLYEVDVNVSGVAYSFKLEVYQEIEQAKEEEGNWFIKIMKWIYKYILTPIGHFFLKIFKWIGNLFKKIWEWIFG